MTPGSIVLVRFPFANLESTKKRPALVLRGSQFSQRSKLIVIAMITSKVEGIRLDGDVILKEWRDANLLHPSKVRLAKLATVDDALIERELGQLRKRDLTQVRSTFKRLFRYWIKSQK